jgi:hypothetical protein
MCSQLTGSKAAAHQKLAQGFNSASHRPELSKVSTPRLRRTAKCRTRRGRHDAWSGGPTIPRLWRVQITSQRQFGKAIPAVRPLREEHLWPNGDRSAAPTGTTGLYATASLCFTVVRDLSCWAVKHKVAWPGEPLIRRHRGLKVLAQLVWKFGMYVRRCGIRAVRASAQIRGTELDRQDDSPKH